MHPALRRSLSGWRRLMIFSFAVLFAAAAVVSSMRETRQYEATALVYLDPSSWAYPSDVADPAIQDATAATFVNSAFSNEVLESVSRQFNIPVDALREGLKVGRVGSTNNMQVAFRSTNRSFPTPVVQAVATAALAKHKASSAETLAEGESVYVDAFNQATAELDAYIDSTGEVAPELHYTALLQEQAIGANFTAELDRLSKIIPEYNRLLVARDRANTLLQGAQGRVLALKAQQAAAEKGIGVSASQATVVPNLVSILSKGFIFGVIGALVGIALLALRALLGPAGPRRPDDSGPQPDSAEEIEEEIEEIEEVAGSGTGTVRAEKTNVKKEPEGPRTSKPVNLAKVPRRDGRIPHPVSN